VRLLHFADLHLGFRQYQRQTPAGINLREADVAQALTRAVDLGISRTPDVIVVAGDVFHQVRPTNPAILHAFAQFARMRQALPSTEIVMVAGNHDTPRSSETVCILRLFAQLGVRVVEGTPQRLHFAERDLSILAVPDVPALTMELSPDPHVTHNVLLMHAEAGTVIPERILGERAALKVPDAVLEDLGWDYIALGHYHVHHPVGPRAYYAGALDYTSADPWTELRSERRAGLPGKGIVEVELASHQVRFLPLPPGRVFLDLPALDGDGLGAVDLDARIAAAVEACAGGIEDKVVRLVVRNVPRAVGRDLDHKKVREWRRRALHFHLDVRRPEVATRDQASGAPGARATLADQVRTRLEQRPLDNELDRDIFVALGLGYLEQVSASTPAMPTTEEA
jgi:DNA repair exonuclease SbcCD nuclease subunit